jgi:hypothetical protein
MFNLQLQFLSSAAKSQLFTVTLHTSPVEPLHYTAGQAGFGATYHMFSYTTSYFHMHLPSTLSYLPITTIAGVISRHIYTILVTNLLYKLKFHHTLNNIKEQHYSAIGTSCPSSALLNNWDLMPIISITQ